MIREPTEQTGSLPTLRRPFLRAIAGGGVLGAFGMPSLALPVGAAIPGVSIQYNRCRSARVTNASTVDSLAVYYADSDGGRQVKYDIDPKTNVVVRGPPQDGEELLIQYDTDTDTTGIRLREPQGSLVCIIAEAGADRTVQTNPTEDCVPDGFNTAPSASFEVSVSPTVDEPVTFTSTAIDDDDPERLYYEWDLDGNDTYEAAGETVTITYSTPGNVTVHHRVTDDCGASDTDTQTITIESAASFELAAKLTPDELVAGDVFGRTVAVDGDTLVVGAPFDDDGGTNAGAVYVYDLADLTVTPEKLTPADLNTDDRFGFSVAVTGDNLAVGAAFDDEEGSNAGAVYLYDLANLAATPQKLTPDALNGDDWFGYAVAIDKNTLAVGAYRDDGNGLNAGAVYVYKLDNLAASPERLTPPGIAPGDNFGISVAIAGNKLAVGAEEDDDAALNGGVVFVYDLSDLSAEPEKLVPTDLGDSDAFGWSLAITDDTLVAGAPFGVTGTGAVYVYDLSDLSAEPEKLVPTELDARDWFGYSVAMADDTLAVGAVFDDDGGIDTGAVYVYDLTKLSAEPVKLVPTELDSGDSFGISMAVAGGTLAVGANADDDKGTNAGAVYVFQ